MIDKTNPTNSDDRCKNFVVSFQEYLDGALPKTRSLELFLHLRECAPCRAQMEETKLLYEVLDSMPELEAPEDFDTKILKSVPYQAYRDMEPLRRDRVPVYLTEEFIPAPLRSLPVRGAGVVLSLLASVGLAASWLPDIMSVVVVAGIVPEALIRLQRLARRHTLAEQESQSG